MSMIFKEGHLFHVFNRGNNRETLFYNDVNYLMFLKKISDHIAPYAEIIAWCLMPNHFQLMIEVKKLERSGYELNYSIGIMLRSYARAINNQEHRVGSLFQSGTKAHNLTEPDKAFLTSRNYFYGPSYSYMIHKSKYPVKCMEYIHHNPVKAGLVDTPSDWKYSSYNEYLGKSNYNLCCKKKGRKYLSFTP
jgi:putative transposase